MAWSSVSCRTAPADSTFDNHSVGASTAKTVPSSVGAVRSSTACTGTELCDKNKVIMVGKIYFKDVHLGSEIALLGIAVHENAVSDPPAPS